MNVLIDDLPMSIKFMLDKRPKTGKQKHKVHCRVILNCTKIIFSIGMETDLKDWIPDSGEFIDNKTQYNLLRNNKLRDIRNKLIQVYLSETQMGFPISAKHVVSRFRGEKPVAMDMAFMDYYDLYLSECRQRPNEYGQGVIEHYVKTQTHLSRFLKLNGWEKIKLSELSRVFIERFEHYLLSTPNKQTGRIMNNNTATTYLRKIRACIGGALRRELLTSNPFAGFKMRNFRGVNKIVLTLEEVARLKLFDTENLSLERVRDAFLMSCECGLRHSDLVRLHEKMIQVDSDGVHWITLVQKKTTDLVEVPMTDYALYLYKKYESYRKESGGYVMPVFTNQKINTSLKLIEKMIGFNKNLTFHCSRHTFATNALEIGTGITAVQAYLGHRDLKSTLVYAKITRKHKTDVLKELNRTATKMQEIESRKLALKNKDQGEYQNTALLPQ